MFDPVKVQRAAEIGYLVLILAVAGTLWVQAGRLPPAPYDPLGPAAFPRAVSVGLAALGAVMALRLVLGRSLGRASHSLIGGLDGEAQHALRPWAAVLTLLFSFAYAGALSVRAVPFVAATAVYLFAAGAILGPREKRRLTAVAIVAVVVAVILDVLFRRVFSLDLS